MIWFLHIFILAIGLTAQSVVAPAVEIFGARPDWLLVGVVLIALHAPPNKSILAAWLVGLAADLLTLEPLGFLGLSYALAAFLVTEVREYLFQYRAMTQFALTASVAIIVQLLWTLYSSIRYDPPMGILQAILDAMGAGLYTGLWAIPIHRALLWVGRPLGLRHPRGLARRGSGVRRSYV